MSLTRLKTPRQTPDAFCPICAMKSAGALTLVSTGLKILNPPFTILQNLKSASVLPCDQNGIPITTPNKWRDHLYFHVEHCLGKVYEEYETGWQTKQRDTVLATEFRRKVKEQGVTGQEDDEELRLKMLIIGSTETYDPSNLVNMVRTRRITKSELIQIFQELMPTIIAQQLQIVARSQVEYLEGTRVDAPIQEFNSMKRCLDVLRMVVGEYGIEDTIA